MVVRYQGRLLRPLGEGVRGCRGSAGRGGRGAGLLLSALLDGGAPTTGPRARPCCASAPAGTAKSWVAVPQEGTGSSSKSLDDAGYKNIHFREYLIAG